MSDHLIHSFITSLGLIDRGRVVEALDEDLGDAISTLKTVGDGKARITLTVTITAKGNDVTLDADVKSKLPETRSFRGTHLWIVGDALSTQHPSQIDLFPRTVADRATG